MEPTTSPKAQKSLFKPFIIILSLLFFLNLCIINYLLFTQKSAPANTQVQQPSKPTSIPTTTPTSATCDETCIKKIVKEATASIILTTPKVLTQQQKTAIPQTTQPLQKEIFISLGSGQNAAGDWSDIPNTEKTINPNQYGNIKTIHFEATLSVPKSEGIAYARLFNATDNKPVEGSDVSATTASPTRLTSQPLTLGGSKLYKVQLKQSQQNDAVLTDSRIKIILN